MIYSASYFEPEYHKGNKICITLTVPKYYDNCIIVDEVLPFLIPEIENITIDQYREQTKKNWKYIKKWLDNLDNSIDQTLLGWAKKEQNTCHRHLIMKLIKHNRPDCYGEDN